MKNLKKSNFAGAKALGRNELKNVLGAEAFPCSDSCGGANPACPASAPFCLSYLCNPGTLTYVYGCSPSQP